MTLVTMAQQLAFGSLTFGAAKFPALTGVRFIILSWEAFSKVRIVSAAFRCAHFIAICRITCISNSLGVNKTVTYTRNADKLIFNGNLT